MGEVVGILKTMNEEMASGMAEAAAGEKDAVATYTHPHQGWIAARAPNRWNSKAKRILAFFDFPAHGKTNLKLFAKGSGGFFLLIQTLPTFWAPQISIHIFGSLIYIPNFRFPGGRGIEKILWKKKT